MYVNDQNTQFPLLQTEPRKLYVSYYMNYSAVLYPVVYSIVYSMDYYIMVMDRLRLTNFYGQSLVVVKSLLRLKNSYQHSLVYVFPKICRGKDYRLYLLDMLLQKKTSV